MRQNKHILLIIALAMAFSCIKPFDPDIDENIQSKYVISGRVTDQEGWQEVNISLSSPVENVAYIPVQGCQVVIEDDLGNFFPLDEYETGNYRVWMEQEYLARGISYRVRVLTPDGQEILSSFDEMTRVPPLDSVYYTIDILPTNDPTVYELGMQFYTDLTGEGYESQYYKWEVVETWEYHVPNAKEYYYDGDWHQIIPPDSSQMICYITGHWPQVFTLSTKSFTSNSFPKFPLHKIDGKSSRLSILYSIMVRQMSLSEAAYNYWEKLRVNSTQEGGLYEKQPLAIKGNLKNINDTSRIVLGYFYAASMSSRRYFYREVEGLEMNFNDYCQEEPLGRMGWREFRPADYPVYYYYNQYHALRILNRECVNCLLRGGTLEKPDFWP